ncbi:MAG: hypothetical protein J0H01_25115 [Rhizobiales bacterium]|nr:hypothetical protein [Hyphomicrobiales bacterium]
MAKLRGRKRKDVRRQPNGQPSRAGRQDEIFAVARNQPHRRGLANFRDERAADPLGRLAMAGLIDTEAYEAGKAWRILVAACRRALDAPAPDPKSRPAGPMAATAGTAEPGTGGIDTRTPEERDRATRRRWAEANGVLRDEGYQVAAEVESVVVDGREARNLPNLARGLAVLAWHFGIAAGRRRTG